MLDRFFGLVCVLISGLFNIFVMGVFYDWIRILCMNCRVVWIIILVVVVLRISNIRWLVEVS